MKKYGVFVGTSAGYFSVHEFNQCDIFYNPTFSPEVIVIVRTDCTDLVLILYIEIVTEFIVPAVVLITTSNEMIEPSKYDNILTIFQYEKFQHITIERSLFRIRNKYL